ncbi:MAG TPA: GDSL-type esterase/lipase family protein [Candidatus Saccharimonadales bacterium]
MKLAIIEGSSTAYGTGSTEHGGWAAAVHRDSLRYNETHSLNPLIVTNLAVPGKNINSVNKDFSEARPSHMTGKNGASLLRILSVGQNEARFGPGMPGPIVSPSAFEGQLIVFAEATAAEGGSAIFVGPQHVDESLTRPCGDTGWTIRNDYIDDYSERIRTVSTEFDIPYVDVKSMFRLYRPSDVLAADGRHPNGFGHSLIHEAVRATISEMHFLDS